MADSRPRRRTLLATAAILIAGAGVFFVGRTTLETPGADLELSGRLLLLPFVDATAQRGNEWVEVGLMELVAETLERTPGVGVVPPQRLLRILAPRALDARDPATRERVRHLGLALGAGLVLDAELTRTDGGYRLGAELWDAGGVAWDGRFEGADPLAAADRLAYALADSLTRGIEPPRLADGYSRSPFFDRLYAMGLERLRVSGPAAALPHFEIILHHQPGFLQAKARLAECARRLGDADRARGLALKLLQEAQARGARRLQIGTLRELALQAALAGHEEEAEQLYSQAYSILLQIEDRPGQADLLAELARLADARGETARTEELQVEILQIRQATGDRLGEAESLVQLGGLLLAGGDAPGARGVFTQAQDIARELGDVWTEIHTAASLGEIARRLGDLAAAEKQWRLALTFYDQRQERSRGLLLKRNLAEVLLATRRFDEAEDLLHEVRDSAAELADQALEAWASVHLAWVVLKAGYPFQARPHLDRALELDRWLDERLPLQRVIAWTAYERGNYRLAMETQRQAKRQWPQQWNAEDERFYAVFAAAREAGRRLPVPGEEGYEEPAAP